MLGAICKNAIRKDKIMILEAVIRMANKKMSQIEIALVKSMLMGVADLCPNERIEENDDMLIYYLLNQH